MTRHAVVLDQAGGEENPAGLGSSSPTQPKIHPLRKGAYCLVTEDGGDPHKNWNSWKSE